jgi:hypothetical protein
MRHAFAFGLLFVLLSMVGPAVVTARAQPTISPKPSLGDVSTVEYIRDVLVGKTQGRLQMRYDPRKSGVVTGTVFGNRIEGYRTVDKATQAQSLAFLQFKRNAAGADVATNVYVADYNTTERAWIGVSYAIDVALGGASAARNATPFRTNGPLTALCASTPACVARNNQLTPLPSVQTPIAIDSAAMAGFGIDANGHLGPLVVRAGAGGNNEGVLSGHVLGDVLSGHYARGAGTIAVLRRQGGQLIQAFTGVLDAGGIKGGRGYLLSANGGAAPFAWRVVANDQIVSGLRSIHERNRCLTPDNPAGGPGGVLSTTTGCTNNVNVSWVVFAVRASGGNTLFSLVSVATGLCLQMPGAVGAAVTQQICNGSRGQVLGIFDLQQTSVQVGNPIFSDIPLNTTAAFTTSSNALNLYVPGPSRGECLGIDSSSGAVKGVSCLDTGTGLMAVIRNSKAAWTHNP